jgi:small conductance mechanosensitive channel
MGIATLYRMAHASERARLSSRGRRMSREFKMGRDLGERAVEHAKRSWPEFVTLLALIAGVLVLYTNRRALFGVDTPVRLAAGIALLILGWAAARVGGRIAARAISRRGVDMAGPIGFSIRLAAITLALAMALRIVGLQPTTVAIGGAATAIIFGLAAQQTLGNLFAGIVLLGARPFRVAERIRLQGGVLAGQIEGVVVDSGLLYTTLARGDDRIFVPNGVVLNCNCAVVPLREPGAVDVRARLRPDVRPSDLQDRLERTLATPTRSAPQIRLEEFEPDEVVLRVTATPAVDAHGPQLTNEVLAALRDIATDQK